MLMMLMMLMVLIGNNGDDDDLVKYSLPLRETVPCAFCGYHRFDVQVQRPEI